MGSPSGDQAVGVFRKKLLEALTDNPGSIEVEQAYLGSSGKGSKLSFDRVPRSESPPAS